MRLMAVIMLRSSFADGTLTRLGQLKTQFGN